MKLRRLSALLAFFTATAHAVTVTASGATIPSGATIVIRSGDFAPGLTRKILSLGTPAVNRGGEVAFVASIAGRSANELDRTGVFTSTAAVAQEFDPAPDDTAGTSADGFTAKFGDPLINDAGDVLFAADIRLATPPGTVRAIFLQRGSLLFRIAAVKQLLPAANETIKSLLDHALLDDGRVVFSAFTKESGNLFTIWIWDLAHGAQLLVRAGDAINIAPIGAPAQLLPLTSFKNFLPAKETFGHASNVAGNHLLIRALCKLTATTSAEVLVDLLAARGSQVLLRGDLPAADISTTRFSGFLYHSLNGSGAALTTKRNPIPPTRIPASAQLVLDTAAGAIATVGDAAPGVNGGIFAKFGNTVGGGGKLAFTGTLRTTRFVVPGIAASNDTGLWQRVGGTLQVVAREGAQVDHGGTLAPYVKSFTSIAMPDDPQVGVLFRGVLGNPPLAAIANRVTAKNDEVLYVADPTGKPTLLLREGVTIPLLPALGPVLDFRALGEVSGASKAVARSYAGDRFAAWVQTLVPGDTFATEAIVVLPLK